MQVRTCEDCGDPVSGRRKRCPDCKRADHARAEKARRETVKSGVGDDSSESAAVGLVVDYTKGAIRPPQFPGRIVPPKPVRVQDVITDGRVPSPAEREPRYDLTGIPASVRQDRVRLEVALARQQTSADEDASDMTSWEALQARNTRHNDGRTVSFHVPAFPPPGPRPVRRVNALGQSIPRSRGWR
jgi:hypothetical protein